MKEKFEEILNEVIKVALEKGFDEQQTAIFFLEKARGLYIKKMKPDKKEKCITPIPETGFWINDGWRVYKRMPRPYPFDSCNRQLPVETFITSRDVDEYEFCYITQPQQKELDNFICAYINIDVDDAISTPYIRTYYALDMKSNTPNKEWNTLANFLKQKQKVELIKCPRCGMFKPASEFTFRDSECRECVQEMLFQPPVWERNKR